MAGLGKGLLVALVLSYVALGGFTQLAYGGDGTTALAAVGGALLLLVLALGVAWATAQRR